MRIFIVTIALLVLCGCYRAAREGDFDTWRPDDSRFTPREREMVEAARSYLDKAQKKPVDAYYKVKHTKDGYEVYVLFAHGYDHGHPLFVPGGFCTVYLREDGSVIRVMGGA